MLMKIVVIGPGALGCLLAASIAIRTDHEIWLQDHDPDRATQLSKRGLLLEENGHRLNCPIKATADPAEIGAADIIFLSVKSHAVAEVLSKVSFLLSEKCLLLALQNGIGHLDILQERMHSNCWAIGVTAQGATLTGTGSIHHAGRGISRIGFLHAADDHASVLLKKTAALLNMAGIETETVPNILDHVWDKLLVNVGINALTAVSGCQNGELPESPSLRKRLTDAVNEAASVARAKGVRIGADPVAATIEVCRATAKNISSMLQDIRRQRFTEIDAINGAVVHEARLLGIPVPENERLVHEVKNLEAHFIP